MISLALNTGARASEILNLRRIDVFITEKSILFKGLKNSNDREIPLTDELFSALTEYLKTHDEERIFPIGYNQLLNIWHYYRPVKKKFHALRHTFAVELYKNTKDIKLVQMALGHRSINNTQIYLDFVYSRDVMRKMLLKKRKSAA